MISCYLLFSIFQATAQDGPMTLLKMDSIFQIEAEAVDGEDGMWQLFYGNRIVFVLSDEVNNRMRIFTSVGAEEDLEHGQRQLLLEANFHSALDAKYSLYNGLVVSVFTHPLKELTTAQLTDALSQVVVLANNFGGSYSSTELYFGFGEEEPKEEALPSDKRINQKPTKKQKE